MWLLVYWATVILFFITALFLLYIPLPPDIADRKKLQVFEFLLRIIYEYPGDFIEVVLGPRIRNQYIRLLIAIGYVIPWPIPAYVKITNESIGGTRVRVYTPKEKKTNAALVFIHGCYDDLMYRFVRGLGITIFSIDYRLAPEYPYPYPVDDCEAVINDLYHDSYIRFGIDRDKICVAGDSAGGNIAAVITQRLAKRNENFLRCQVLIYPVIHVFSFQSSSYLAYYEKYNGTSLLNPRAMARWILLYLGLPATKRNVEKLTTNQHISKKLASSPEMQKVVGPSIQNIEKKSAEALNQEDEIMQRTFATKGTDPDVCPLFGVSKNLPPTLVLTAEYDILRDEGAQYATRLKEEGVPCERKHYKSAFHGVCNMPYSLVKRDMTRDICSYLQSYI
ncbi:hydrolase, alpha/beta domain protein [Oesophagostomum dentatum]|uniref:Hydrolase, alpha/beta domain protein n=1 Tax=Oesophagostomum dentatum TaxID=61180 RepID=A0A0B1TQJ5_OESDE|nr:hydrolase, alpha/beta domain protein [Oesophagostomum dentatum]